MVRPEGKLFVQIFCHREMVYPFESVGAVNWMARHFFTGGIMPSIDLLGKFDRDVKINRQWVWNGHHYQRTSDAWLANLDARQDELLGILRTVYGRRNAYRWFNRCACSSWPWPSCSATPTEKSGVSRNTCWNLSALD